MKPGRKLDFWHSLSEATYYILRKSKLVKPWKGFNQSMYNLLFRLYRSFVQAAYIITPNKCNTKKSFSPFIRSFPIMAAAAVVSLPTEIRVISHLHLYLFPIRFYSLFSRFDIGKRASGPLDCAMNTSEGGRNNTRVCKTMIRLFRLGLSQSTMTMYWRLRRTILLGCPFKVDAVAQKMLALKSYMK